MRLNTKEWDRVWPLYMKVSKRDYAESINTKLLYTAFGALARTPKADLLAMQSVLGPVAVEQTHTRVRLLKKGGVKRGRVMRRNIFAAAAGREVPRLALIINARRQKEGKPLLFGEEMDREMNKVWNARKASVAFLKSGWLPSIQLLKPLVRDRKGITPQDRSAKRRGQPKGFAVAATPSSWRPTGKIVNTANAKRDDKGALVKYGGPALQAAFAHEVASMKEYIARKLTDSARRLGIRTR